MENSVFFMAYKEVQFHIVKLINQSMTFSINLNAQHVNGMTHFYLVVNSVKLIKMKVRQFCSYF